MSRVLFVCVSVRLFSVRAQVPELNEDFGADAASFLAQLVGNGKRFVATVVRRERGLGAREKHPRKAADKLQVGAVNTAAGGVEHPLFFVRIRGGCCLVPRITPPGADSGVALQCSCLLTHSALLMRKLSLCAWQHRQRLCGCVAGLLILSLAGGAEG